MGIFWLLWDFAASLADVKLYLFLGPQCLHSSRWGTRQHTVKAACCDFEEMKKDKKQAPFSVTASCLILSIFSRKEIKRTPTSTHTHTHKQTRNSTFRQRSCASIEIVYSITRCGVSPAPWHRGAGLRGACLAFRAKRCCGSAPRALLAPHPQRWLLHARCRLRHSALL